MPLSRDLLQALLLLTLLHFVVDVYALFLGPLAPDLQAKLQLTPAGMQWSLATWGLSQSLFQFVFGVWGDRYHSRWLLWVGPLLGIVGASSVGLVDSAPALIVLLVIGGMGIAAFHPEAAATVGGLSPEHRSRIMSIFMVGGYAGQAIGPTYSGEVVSHWGLPALAWSILPGLIVLALISRWLHSPSATPPRVAKQPIALADLLRGRTTALGVLVLIGMLRAVTSVGLPQALAYILKAAGESTATIGQMQSWYWAGIGLGGLACSTLVRRSWERNVLWIMPLVATPPLLLAAHGASPAWLPILMLCAGASLGSSFPVQISYGQQLLHEAPRVASSLSMGVVWGLAALVVAASMAWFNEHGRPDQAAVTFAWCCAVSSGLCVFLPRLKQLSAASVATSPETRASQAPRG